MLDNRLDDISRIMHKGGTIADKLVATILSWIKWRSGNGHHLIAAFTRFTRVISNPDLVAASITTAPSARRGSRAHFGQKQSFINDLQKQGSIFRWIDNINTASNYPNRARFHGTAMDKRHQYRAPCQTQSHSLPRQARAPEFRHCEWH